MSNGFRELFLSNIPLRPAKSTSLYSQKELCQTVCPARMDSTYKHDSGVSLTKTSSAEAAKNRGDYNMVFCVRTRTQGQWCSRITASVDLAFWHLKIPWFFELAVTACCVLRSIFTKEKYRFPYVPMGIKGCKGLGHADMFATWRCGGPLFVCIGHGYVTSKWDPTLLWFGNLPTYRIKSLSYAERR